MNYFLASLAAVFAALFIWQIRRERPWFPPDLYAELVFPFYDGSVGIFVVNYSRKYLPIEKMFLTIVFANGMEGVGHWPVTAGQKPCKGEMPPKTSHVWEFAVSGFALPSYGAVKCYGSIILKDGTRIDTARIQSPPPLVYEGSKKDSLKSKEIAQAIAQPA